MFPIMTNTDKMRPQSNIQPIQSFWREIWITMQPQQTSSHFKEHIHPPKHHEFAGKGFRIPWIAINVLEAKCSSSISLYSHKDLLVQSTNMQISKTTSGLWDGMREKYAFSYSQTEMVLICCRILKLAS